MRKFLAVSICAAMLVSCIAGTAVTAYADEAESVGVVSGKLNIQPSGNIPNVIMQEKGWLYGFQDTEDDTTAGIFDYVGNEKVVTIPDMLNNHKITRISWFGMAGDTTNSNRDFSKGPFANNTNICELIIPDSVDSIQGLLNEEGYRAFENCTNLTKVTIPNSVTSISEGTFYNCPNLTIYGVKGSVAEDYALRNKIPFVGISSGNAESQPVESKNEEVVTSEKPVNTSTPNFDKYFKETVRLTNGSADTSDKTKKISVDNQFDDSWSSRNGNLGYDVDDFNNDGENEMLVYSFSNHSLVISSYKANEKGEIGLVDSVLVFEQYNATVDYCVGEIVELNGKKCLLIEEVNNASFFSDGKNVRYYVYEINNNGRLFLKYHIGMNGAASSPIRYYLTQYSESDASSKVIWDNSNKSNVSSNEALQSAFKEIGLSATDKTIGDVMELMGYKNYKKDYDDYPTYYFNSSVKFNLVNAPVDYTYRKDGIYEFKSTVKYYDKNTSSSNTNNGNTVSNSAGTTSTTVKSPQTGAANNYAAILAVVIAGGAAAAFAGFKRREDI